MLCLDVAVNGERYCLAGADDVRFAYAKVASRLLVPRLFASGFELHVHALQGGNDLFDAGIGYWGKWALPVKVGDVVTIRLVESDAPDTPLQLPLPGRSASLNGVVQELQLFTYSTRVPDGLGGLLIWVAIAILGILLLYVTKRG